MGQTPSSPVRSFQTRPHPNLPKVVARHLVFPDRTPIPDHTLAAFEALQAALKTAPYRPIVLDGGCGTGHSTLSLSKKHPAAWIVGIDQSAARLGRGLKFKRQGALLRIGERTLLVRAEQGGLYRCLRDTKVRIAAHYLLYPNPWPKAGHLMRRWHAHPSMPSLFGLGGRLVLRSNWMIYLEEMAVAVRIATGASASVHALSEQEVLSPFERKYAMSGHALWELSVCLKPLLPRSEAVRAAEAM